MTSDEMILICAVRYTLGRMSYMVSVVCDYVKGKRSELSHNCINIIIHNIEEELERYHNLGETLGMECDEKNWLELLNVLKVEVNKND